MEQLQVVRIDSMGLRTIGKRTQSASPLFFAAPILLAASATAFGDTMVTMQLTGPPPGPSLGGVYTDPYTVLIGPAGQNPTTYAQQPIVGTSLSVLCDDFSTDVSVGSTLAWQATVTNMSAFNGITNVDTVKFETSSAGTSAATQMRDYMTVAYLSGEIMSVNPYSIAAMEMSYSLWAIFDPLSDPNGPLSGGYIQNLPNGPRYLTDAANYLNSAYAHVDTLISQGKTGSYFSNINVYTPDPTSVSQEYLDPSVPEPGTHWLFGLGLLALFWSARRTHRAAPASK